MKLTAPPKKVKSTLSKVSKNKVTKKREKDGLGKKKQAVLELASESLSTPEKKIVAKALKQKKPALDSPVPNVPLKKLAKALKSPVSKSSLKAKSVKSKKEKIAASPVVSKSLKKKNITAESPVVAKPLKTKKKTSADSPVVAKPSKKKNLAADSPSMVESLPKKKKKKNVADSPVVAKSGKKIKSIADSPVVAKPGKKNKANVDSSVSSVSLQKPTKVSKKQAKTTLIAETVSANKAVPEFSKRIQTKKSKQPSLANSNKLTKAEELSVNLKTEVALDEKLLEGVCASALKLVNKSQEDQEKKDLFGSLGQPIYFQVVLFKVPVTPTRVVRCDLPNSIHATEPEVLLILPDIKRGRFRDITFAKYLQEYEEKLSEAGIKGIKQIILYTQLRAEYSQFEMKRRLVNSFDVMLCDGRIEGACTHFLGAALKKCNKYLTPIKAVNGELKGNGTGLREVKFVPGLQKHVDRACHKVPLKLQPTGSSCSLILGHSQFNEKQLAENVKTVWSFLSKELPGGTKNIKTAYLRGAKTLSVPVYASLTPPSEVPIVAPKTPRDAVEDELSTVPGFTATVDSLGNVQLHDKRTAADKKFYEEILGSNKSLKRPIESQEGPKSKQSKKNDDSDESDDGEEDLLQMINTAAEEEAYMKQWAQSTADLEEQENKPKKSAKKKNKKGSDKAAKNPKGQEKTASKKVKVLNAKQPVKKGAAPKKLKKAKVSKPKA